MVVWGIRAENRLETAEHLQRDLASRTLLKMRGRTSLDRHSKWSSSSCIHA